MKEPQIELEIINILERCRDTGFDIIFVFDELDKISLSVSDSNAHQVNDSIKKRITDHLEDETIDEHVYRRKKRVDSLLASLKTLITTGKARFFFIAGRDILDSYQSEKGSTSSLYESLFNQVFEVPSFLTDDSDQDKSHLHSMIEAYVCSKLLQQNTAKRYWLVNEICGDFISKLDDKTRAYYIQALKKIRDINDKLENEENNQEDCRNKPFQKKIIMEFSKKLLKDIKCWEKNNLGRLFPKIPEFRIYKNTDFLKKKLEDMREGFLHEDEDYKQLTSLARFIRAILIECYNYKKLERWITKSNNPTFEKIENCDSYYFYRLNVYYLYLTNNDEVSIKDAELVIYRLRQFINYLTVHSWGNCKRLSLLFESFTKPFSMAADTPNSLDCPKGQDTKYMLHFDITETQRICMGSNLYTLFNHHLSRQFTGADKLVVSSLAALHYCLKFHRNAFSRHHLFRMTEMMSIYSSPELNSIFETTLTQVLWPYTRVIRNGMFRYRFFTWVEQEIRYIARVDDIESASYTFSLDAINDIKAHYRKTLANAKSSYETIRNCSEEKGPGLIAELNIVLGDIYFLERAYDEAVVFYQTAVNAHHSLKDNQNYHLECLMRYVEALLKLGNVQEHRQRFERAAMNYYQAKQLVDAFLEQHGKLSHNPYHELRRLGFYKKDQKQEIKNLLIDGDSKWVLLKQPYWAFLYLNIKRGYGHRTETTLPKHLYGKSDPYGIYNQGQLFFYLGRYDKAKDAFVKVIPKSCKL